MGEMAKLAGVPVSVKLGDKEYELRPLKPADLGELEVYLEERQLEKAKKQLELMGAEINALEREKILSDARKPISLASGEMVQFLASVSGTIYLLWLCLRDKYELTKENVEELISFENLDEIQKSVDKASGLGGEESDFTKPKAKAKAKDKK